MSYLTNSFTLFVCISTIEAARILAVFPTPSISHQVVFRPLVHELTKRGHDVVVLTTDPVYSKEKAPANLTEINVHDISYSIWKNEVLNTVIKAGEKDCMKNQMDSVYTIFTNIFEAQMKTDAMQNILKQKFDFLITEAYYQHTLGLRHIFKVPVIQMSSLLPVLTDSNNLGAPNHPILYPSIFRQKINNITLWEKITELYNIFVIDYNFRFIEMNIERSVRKIFGSDVPSLNELRNHIDMLFLNSYPIWDSNRPVPPSVVYLGGICTNPIKELPADLKTYLDSSKNGVIYVSFGTNVDPAFLPPEKIQMFVRVFSRLSYDILWKWDQNELPGRSANIRISKWLPQTDLLRHPKIKLYIMQGGLQSTDEAITAGVPLIGIPMLADQWYNVEQYVRHKIGIRLDIDDIDETKLKNAIDMITTDVTYRKNIVKLHSVLWDRPETPLQRAVWWTEHVLRHGGDSHLRSPAANLSLTDYFEVELLFYVFLGLQAVISITLFVGYYILKTLRQLILFQRHAVL